MRYLLVTDNKATIEYYENICADRRRYVDVGHRSGLSGNIENIFCFQYWDRGFCAGFVVFV